MKLFSPTTAMIHDVAVLDCRRGLRPRVFPVSAGRRWCEERRAVTDRAYNHSMRFARHFIRPDAESAE
jgi:hypothetical protein